MYFDAIDKPSEEEAIKTIDFCIQAGLDKNVTYSREIILRNALYYNKIQIAKHLIKIGVDVNATDHFGSTALFAASYRCSPDVVKMLIDAGANINYQNPHHEKNTALILALDNRQLDNAKILVGAGVDVNLQTVHGSTALHKAASGGNKDIVVLLLEHGADPTIKNNKDKLPSDLTYDKDIIKILKEAEEKFTKKAVEPVKTSTPVVLAYKFVSAKIQFNNGLIFNGTLVDEKPHEGTLTFTDGFNLPCTFNKDGSFTAKFY
jgi:ankyrin repeat protein